MPHIGCGADILRLRREREVERKRLVALGIIKEPEAFTPCRNPQFPHKTKARNPDVFSNLQRRFSNSSLKLLNSPPSSLPSPRSLLLKNSQKFRSTDGEGFAPSCSRSSVDLRKLSSSSAPSRPERASCSSVSSEESTKSRGIDRYRMRRSSTLLDSFKIPEEIKMAESPALSSKRKKMMQRSAAIDNPETLEENATVFPKASRLGINSNVKEKIRRFQEKSFSLDLDTDFPEHHKSNTKLFNKDRYNRVRQKFLQKSSSVDLDEGWNDDDMVMSETSRLSQWLSCKSIEQNPKEEQVSFTQAVDRKKKKLLRSSSVTERKTLLPLSAFQSFDCPSSVGSIEEEIHKLTIEAEIHGDNVESERVSASEASEASSDLLLEANLIRTEGKLVKLASIDELIEYEQGEKVGKLNR